MKMSLNGKIELIGHEGICFTKYLDSVGVWTIGVGATSTEIPDIASWPLDKKLSMDEVIELFEKSLARYEKAINDCLNVKVTQEQFDALVSWCYNVGVGWPKKSTVIRLLNNGTATNDRLYNALLMFDKPKEIIGRRTKEAKLLTGYGYQNGGKATVFPVSDKGYPMYNKGKTIRVAELLNKTTDVEQPKEEQKQENVVVEKQGSFLMEIIKFIFRWKKY